MKFLLTLIVIESISAQFNLIGGFGSAGGLLWRPAFRDPSKINSYGHYEAVVDEGDNNNNYEVNEENEETNDTPNQKLTYHRPSYQQSNYASNYQRPSYEQSSSFCKNPYGGFTPCHLLRY